MASTLPSYKDKSPLTLNAIEKRGHFFDFFSEKVPFLFIVIRLTMDGKGTFSVFGSGKGKTPFGKGTLSGKGTGKGTGKGARNTLSAQKYLTISKMGLNGTGDLLGTS